MHADKTLSLIEARNTLNQVNLKIPSFPIGHESRELLEQMVLELESLIWQLVHEDINEVMEDLISHQHQLKELNKNLDAGSESLEKIRKMIENVSQLIGSLTGFFG